jgi:hypothetical protein
MKSQADLPAVAIEAPNRRGAKIALISLGVAALLLGAWKASGSLDNPILDALSISPIGHSQISGAHRISLEADWLSLPADQSRQFSVAHPLPDEVALPQRYSIGADERDAFESFGEAAFREMRENERRPAQVKAGDNGLMLMLMLSRLRPRRY